MSERNGFEAGVPCWVDTWQKDAAAAIGSPIPEGAPPTAVWSTYVKVDSADESAAKAREAGGEVLVEPFDSRDRGKIAIVADPSGAVLGLWEQGEHNGAQLVNEPSAWSMSSCHTRDPEAWQAVLLGRVRMGGGAVRHGWHGDGAVPAPRGRGR